MKKKKDRVADATRLLLSVDILKLAEYNKKIGGRTSLRGLQNLRAKAEVGMLPTRYAERVIAEVEDFLYDITKFNKIGNSLIDYFV